MAGTVLGRIEHVVFLLGLNRHMLAMCEEMTIRVLFGLNKHIPTISKNNTVLFGLNKHILTT